MESLVHVPTLPGVPFRLPPQLDGLRRLAYNLWWTWHPGARALFSRLDGAAWARYRNPIPLLEGPVGWAEALENPDLLAEYQSIIREFDGYLANGSDHWFHRQYASALDGPIASFCGRSNSAVIAASGSKVDWVCFWMTAPPCERSR